MSGRRLSDNEIIAAYRAMQTNPNWRVRFFRFVIPRLPRPIAKWVVTMMGRVCYRITMTRYTQADWDACGELVERMWRQRQ